MPLLYLIIYNRVPTIHKQPAEPHFTNDTDSNCSTFLMLLVTLTLTVLDINQLIPCNSTNINSLTAKSVLAGEKLVAMYSIST